MDTDVEYDTFILRFLFAVKGLNVGVTYTEPAMFSETRWKQFAGSVYDHKQDSLVFCGGNGRVELFVIGTVVGLDVDKSGSGGDGDIAVEVPADEFYPILMQAIQAMKKAGTWKK